MNIFSRFPLLITGVSFICVPPLTDFQNITLSTVLGNKSGYYIMIKGPIHPKDIIVQNMYALKAESFFLSFVFLLLLLNLLDPSMYIFKPSDKSCYNALQKGCSNFYP